MRWQRPQVHLARCDYCDKRIAWSRKRRQWLALAPVTTMHGTQLGRRMTCASSHYRLHDPRANVFGLLVPTRHPKRADLR